MKVTDAPLGQSKATADAPQFVERPNKIFNFFWKRYVQIANWPGPWRQSRLPQGFEEFVKNGAKKPRASELPKSIADLVAQNHSNISVAAAKPEGFEKECYVVIVQDFQDVKNLSTTFMAFDENGKLAGETKIVG